MADPNVNVTSGAILLPFQPSIANYDFDCAINDITYNFRVRWNDRANVDPITGLPNGAWYFDISAQDLTPIISGLKIVLGAYIGRQSNDPLFKNGVITAWDTSGAEKDAGFDDIGTRVIVQYIPVLELIRRLSEPPNSAAST